MFKVKFCVQVQVEKEDVVNDEMSILIEAIFLFQDRLKTCKKVSPTLGQVLVKDECHH